MIARGAAAARTWQPSQFLSVLDLTPEDLEICLALAAEMKAARAAGHPHAVFPTTYDELLRLTAGHPTEVA